VAGTVAAKNDGVGVIGVAAGAELVAIKVLDRRGSGSYDGVIAGIDYVANNGSPGDVANMSLGGPVSQALDDAVIAAAAGGIKFALAAGNESDDANNHSPARANHANIYTISAMGENDAWAYFSNYGNPPVDYCQPGVNIYSTYKNGGYTTMSGTSMASPHMAGLLLLENTKTDGTVNGDPDGNADPILVYGGTVPPPPPPDNVEPEADFTWSASELTVNFTDASTDTDGSVVAWNWNFGDGSSSTLQNPTKTYASAGTYTVTLTVTDDDGDTASKSQNVTVTDGGTTNNPPSVGFSFSTNDLTATFTDQSSDTDGSVVDWNWNFGDGGTSTAQNTSHTYFTGGTYTVTLTVTDDDGATDTTSKSVTVTTSQTSDINLQATLRKVRGVRYVDLTWSGAEGTNISIKVNGSTLTTTGNDGSETLNMARSSGTFVFQVCETDDSACSNEVTLTL
jgi:PKD repeat protein